MKSAVSRRFQISISSRLGRLNSGAAEHEPPLLDRLKFVLAGVVVAVLAVSILVAAIILGSLIAAIVGISVVIALAALIVKQVLQRRRQSVGPYL
jgi:hypothetical protein